MFALFLSDIIFQSSEASFSTLQRSCATIAHYLFCSVFRKKVFHTHMDHMAKCRNNAIIRLKGFMVKILGFRNEEFQQFSADRIRLPRAL